MLRWACLGAALLVGSCRPLGRRGLVRVCGAIVSTAVAPPAHGLGSPTEVPGISTDMVPGTDELISRVRVLCAGDSDASVEKATVLRLQDATQAAMSRTLGAKVTSRLLQDSAERMERMRPEFDASGCRAGMSATDELNLMSFGLFRTLNTAPELESEAVRRKVLLALGEALIQQQDALLSSEQLDKLRQSPETYQKPSMLKAGMEAVLLKANNLGFMSTYGICEAPRDHRKPTKKGALVKGSSFPGLEDQFCLDDELAASEGMNGETNAIVIMDGLAYRRATLRLASDAKFFWPDYIGSAIMALAAECGYSAAVDQYFSDTVYHPDPKDYDPTQTVQEWTFSRSKRQ